MYMTQSSRVEGNRDLSAIGGIARCELGIMRKLALIHCRCTSFQVCARLSSINYHQVRTVVGPASALPLTQLEWAYGLCHRPCNRELSELDCNLSNIIDAAIGSLRVLV